MTTGGTNPRPRSDAGYSANSVPWGLKIGGADACKFDKDLAVAPAPCAKGRRFDSSSGELISMALSQDRLLERHSRYQHLPRRLQPRWPRLWAAFSPDVASQLEMAGPEFESEHRRIDCSTIPLLARTAPGLMLYPLAYVSHAWRQILTIFADLTTVPKRQVISLSSDACNLRGHEGAVEFDLVSSRFTTSNNSRRRSTPRKHHAPVLAS